MRVVNPLYARPGDTVVVGMQGEALVVYSLLAYLLPLLGLIIAAVSGARSLCPARGDQRVGNRIKRAGRFVGWFALGESDWFPFPQFHRFSASHFAGDGATSVCSYVPCLMRLFAC